MTRLTNFFFSKILNNEVHNISGQTIGRLSDLILDFNQEKPTVMYMQIRDGRRKFYAAAEALNITKNEKERYNIEIKSETLLIKLPDENDIFLVRDFLDKQIVDINGRKVERVNDVRLGYINNNWLLLAVDIGTRGLLRRLGVEYTFIKLSGLINYQLRNKLIIWDNVQPLSTGTEKLKLLCPANRIETLHAADIADIIEELHNKNANVLFNSLNNQKAAEVFEEIETDVKVNLLKTMSDEKASDILEILPSDEIADILEEIDEDRAEKLLTKMDEDSQEEIRELMEYEKETVGSLMSKDFLTFLPDVTVEDILNWFQKNHTDEEESYNLYITNDRDNLLGIVSLFSIVTSDRSTKIYNIMTAQPKRLKDIDFIEDAIELMQKYNLISLPVLDENNCLVGVITLNDSIHELMKLRRIAL
ncbi:magnesium transporter MgtE N-terminal domain-containing protein [Clostridium oryzae]|nr:CBS domain-containing protein [Clostridium oryzae]